MAAMNQAMALEKGSEAETAGQQQGDGDGGGGGNAGESLAQHNAAAAAEAEVQEGEDLSGGTAEAAEVARHARQWAKQRAAAKTSNNQMMGNEARADEGQLAGEGEGGRRLGGGRRVLEAADALTAVGGDGGSVDELQMWVLCSTCAQIVEEELKQMDINGVGTSAAAARNEKEEDEEQLVPTFVTAPYVTKGGAWRRAGSPFVGHISDDGGGFGIVLGKPLTGPTSSSASSPSAQLLDAAYAQQHWGASYIAFLPPAAAELVIVRLQLADVTITPSQFRQRGAGSVHDGLRSALASALEVPPRDVGLFDPKWAGHSDEGGSQNLLIRVEIKVVSMGAAERVMAELQGGATITNKLTEMLEISGQHAIKLPADKLSFTREREARIDENLLKGVYGRFSGYPLGLGWLLATLYGTNENGTSVADRILAALVLAALAAMVGFFVHHCQAMTAHRMVVHAPSDEGETKGFAGTKTFRRLSPESMTRKASIRHFEKKQRRNRRRGSGDEASRVTVRVVGGGSWWEEIFLVLTGPGE
jgi:hypothetical protein